MLFPYLSMLFGQIDGDSKTPPETNVPPADAANSGGDQAFSIFGFDLERLTPQLVNYLAAAVGAVVLLLVAWIISGIVSRLIRKSLERTKFDDTLTRFFSRLAKWAVLLLAVLACLSIFGVETTSFAAVIGAAGLAIGLAFQGSLSNFASGVMLLVFRPFKVGDVVRVAGETGKVEEIELFTTTLDTPDNRRIIVPNSAVFGSTIENISHHPHRRADVNVGVDYDADVDAVRAVLEKAVQTVPDQMEDPAPAVVLQELGGSSVDWTVRVWAKAEHFWDVRQATVRAVKLALDEAGIGIPYPQMDVHLDHAPGAPTPPASGEVRRR